MASKMFAGTHRALASGVQALPGTLRLTLSPFRGAGYAHPTQVHTRATPPEGEDISDVLKADLERFQAKASQQATPSGAPESNGSNAGAAPTSSLSASVKEAIDKILIADFFVVLFALGWLGVGVVLANSSGTGSSPVLDAWYPLWPTLWQSAIGLLMAGALVSGGLGWIASKQQEGREAGGR